MYRAAFGLTALFMLTACAGMGVAPRPAEVRLTRDALVVRLSDNSRCEMARPEGAVWAGRLEGCALDWPYEVMLDERSNILREIVEAIFTPDNGVVRLSALGTVTITDPDSGEVYSFVSPKPQPEEES